MYIFSGGVETVQVALGGASCSTPEEVAGRTPVNAAHKAMGIIKSV